MIECAYGFSYTKLNGRRALMDENPDYDPWSIRQAAIYQQYSSLYDRITFILVAPSDEVRKDLEYEIVQLTELDKRPNAFALHLTIFSTLHDNWTHYLRDLGNSLKLQVRYRSPFGVLNLTRNQSDNVMLKQVRSEPDLAPHSSELPFTFLDRQRLQLMEDKILDLVVIFDSLLDTILRLKLQCQKHCRDDACVDCRCMAINDNFEQLEYDIQLNLKKIDTLYKRAQGTTQLVRVVTTLLSNIQSLIKVGSSRISWNLRMLRLQTQMRSHLISS